MYIVTIGHSCFYCIDKLISTFNASDIVVCELFKLETIQNLSFDSGYVLVLLRAGQSVQTITSQLTICDRQSKKNSIIIHVI